MRSVPLGIGVVVLLAFSFGAIGSDPETWPIVYRDDFEDPASG